MKYCDKCGKHNHHPFNCPKFLRHTIKPCGRCSRYLLHCEYECIDLSREDDVRKEFRQRDTRDSWSQVQPNYLSYSHNTTSHAQLENNKQSQQLLSSAPVSTESHFEIKNERLTECNTVDLKGHSKIHNTSIYVQLENNKQSEQLLSSAPVPTESHFQTKNDRNTEHNKGDLKGHSNFTRKHRTLEDDISLMEIYGDKDLKHFLSLKGTVSTDFHHIEQPNLDVHQSHTLHKVIDRIMPIIQDGEWWNSFDDSIYEMKGIEQKKAKIVKLNNILNSSTLFFVKACIDPDSCKNKKFENENITCLVDTGSEVSFINIEIIEKLKIEMLPIKLTLHSATGQNKDAIKGKVHLNIFLKTTKGKILKTCLTFLVIKTEGNIDGIIGADLLLYTKELVSLNSNCLTWKIKEEMHNIRIGHVQDIRKQPDIHINAEKNKEIIHTVCTQCKARATLWGQFTYNYSFHFKGDLSRETLPSSEEFLGACQELNLLDLNKKHALNDGDYSNCPEEYRDTLMRLLSDFEDRFMETDLDIEFTCNYEAELETLEDSKLVEKTKRLPSSKFESALEAIKQLEAAGIVSQSDSAWRSNTVLIACKNGESSRYKIGLDFKELNQILLCPKNVHFATLDELLSKLKGKVVVRLDMSSTFLMIPIRSEDRYKTSFWLNDLAFEFNVLVKSLKSSYFHIQKLMDETFSSDAFTEYSTKLSEKERMLLPLSFEDIIITNIDDAFIFAENIEQLLVCLKLVLMVARDAKLKFSVEKSVFVTTKLQVAGYDFDTKNAALTMDKLKSSAILNMKRPNSLNELHNRICVFSYHSAFLPYLKHVLYPLNHLIKVGKFKWTSVEEEAWMSAKELCSLNLRLTIPDAEDDLVLATDASRIAASACLFRVKHGKLELVSVNSKYFSVTDMTKCSYVLESIALAYGLKMCASYILNCKGTVKLFTDNRSLTYAKRETKRSIMVNSVLNYIQNFLSTANIEIYHLPGQLNICADVFSRAISENLNCSILKEHPISKKWASVLPPIPDNFSVDNETLFKFLTSPLKNEIQDTHNKTHRKLAEPRTVQTWFDMTSEASSEQRFNEALDWLKKWNLDYTREQREIKEIRGNLDMQKKRACLDKIQEILNNMYGDIKIHQFIRR